MISVKSCNGDIFEMEKIAAKRNYIFQFMIED